ncbi:peptide/nickel transport system ATP-binding protein [Paenibacillus cellulosilyticus]|uniref:Peptide/nickel transport system ATP-binding protein n=1 Tax=Paenibacillus cellulosilyticus TaxID=375489 RepID=A0A2V2YNB9_9BACL|nr:ABC transporter ATP-binding protein [Paenibacillus cellulosilyticus]PWV97320.1 peptide/nickel transport system ATP-binding protein [Paenibacillus cellulosilyticus]QKS47480.1 ABC transporter ATP-binding protein [Paenibacillus cellulosilyticus]
MGALLDIRKLSVDFQTKHGLLTAISEVSFSIQPGETVCLVGESGSGKTVTSKAIMRLIEHESGRITEGSVLLSGQDVAKLPEAELRRIRGKRVAMVFQEPMAAFDPVFTIGQQIAETILRHERASKREAWERGVQLLKRVGIPEPELRMKQYPGELSGGMLQRAMIAMALSCGPELLIADEPTTALDVTIQAQILQLLQELKHELGMSILLITHDLGIAAEIADRVIVMYAGQIVEEGATAELFAQPLHPYTRGLLQSAAPLDSVRGSRLHAIQGAIPSLAALPSGCLFHPRCEYATDRCRTEAPPLIGQAGREAACWHIDTITSAVARSEGVRPEDQRSGLQESFIVTREASSSVIATLSSVFHSTDELHGGQSSSPSTSDDLFEVVNLHKYYPLKRKSLTAPRSYVRAVDDVSFSIRRNETFGLVGESGSGKSTLGRVLLQLEQATSGQIHFQGTDLTSLTAAQLRPLRREMQVIFQDPYGSLSPRWTVGDSIAEPLKVHGVLTARECRERAEELLQLVGLDASSANKYPHEFSGGQRQRIGIARAIALNPSFILADEAVSALDVSVQAQIVNLLQDLQQKLGLTYLFIAHGLQIVRHISDRIGVMYLGKLVEIAPSEELFLRPAHPYTRLLIDSIPQPIPGKRRDTPLLQGEIPSPSNPPSGCRFHTRCPFATARCKEEQPALRPLDDDRYVACHYSLV